MDNILSHFLYGDNLTYAVDSARLTNIFEKYSRLYSCLLARNDVCSDEYINSMMEGVIATDGLPSDTYCKMGILMSMQVPSFMRLNKVKGKFLVRGQYL